MNIVQNAIDYAVSIAKDDSHGYDQIKRWGPDYDCSSLVIESFAQAGTKVKENGATYTGNMRAAFLKSGFVDVTSLIELSNGENLEPGDVLLNVEHHTELYIGDGRTVTASINEKGTISGGKSGDQTGKEIRVRDYHNYPWNCVLRYHDEADEEMEAPAYYSVKSGDTLTKIAKKFGTTVSVLVALNRLKNPDLIFVGQDLLLPTKAVKAEIWEGVVVTESDPLNIRLTPNGSIIGSIGKGQTVKIKGDNMNGWLKLADRDGFVFAKYVQRI